MRTAILLAAGLSVLFAPIASASIVIHDGAPGIVAAFENVLLDHNGLAWAYSGGQWIRWENGSYDPPLPVDQIMFWELFQFVSMSNEFWRKEGELWINHGVWPGLPAIVGELDPAKGSAVSPNPSAGDCRIEFDLQVAGPVSVGIYDATGRAVRELLSGDHPAGVYSLRWDGRDDEDIDLPAGVYFSHVTTGGRTVTSRIVLTR